MEGKNEKIIIPLLHVMLFYFILFDVNGHEIHRGVLKNNMEIPAYPIVIKIQNFGSNLLK